MKWNYHFETTGPIFSYVAICVEHMLSLISSTGQFAKMMQNSWSFLRRFRSLNCGSEMKLIVCTSLEYEEEVSNVVQHINSHRFRRVTVRTDLETEFCVRGMFSIRNDNCDACHRKIDIHMKTSLKATCYHLRNM